jgi:hypothetical protein
MRSTLMDLKFFFDDIHVAEATKGVFEHGAGIETIDLVSQQTHATSNYTWRNAFLHAHVIQPEHRLPSTCCITGILPRRCANDCHILLNEERIDARLERAKSADKVSFGTSGTTETPGILRSPPVAFGDPCRLLSFTLFQSSSGECQLIEFRVTGCRCAAKRAPERMPKQIHLPFLNPPPERRDGIQCTTPADDIEPFLANGC